MKIVNNVLIADEGHLLKRKRDSLITKKSYLGYIYYLNGIKLEKPYKENSDDYIEISEEEVYAERVSDLIREKYSLDAELAIQRQRDTKPEAFKEYFDYCEECKNKAKFA